MFLVYRASRWTPFLGLDEEISFALALYTRTLAGAAEPSPAPLVYVDRGTALNTPMIRALLIASAVLAAGGSAAANPGDASCAVWLTERITTGAPDLRTWALNRLQQYASGLPEHAFASFADNNNILTHLDIYCEAHPSDHLDRAVQSVIGDFEELRETLKTLRKGG